jgi:hypothetical protein
MTREYVDRVLNTLKVIDVLIERCQDRDYSLSTEYIPFLKFASDCVKETLYEEFVDE